MMNFYVTLMFLILSSSKEIASICNSPLGLGVNTPTENKIPNHMITASSQKFYRNAEYGRLDLQYRARVLGGWCPSDSDRSPYLQINLGKMTTVSAVGLQAQDGLRSYVETYTITYSYDGNAWYSYKGNGNKVLQGNKDGYEVSTAQLDRPITAKLFRIKPRSWNTEPCLRAELYGCEPQEDCKASIGISGNTTKVSNKQMSASSTYLQHYAYEGRINNTMRLSPNGGRSWAAWCATAEDKTPYLQIDLGRVRVISGVATQGYMSTLWTTQYIITYSVDGKTWTKYRENDIAKLFVANSDTDSIKLHYFQNHIRAKFIRFNPTKWNNLACLRVEIYECVPQKESVPQVSQPLPTSSEVLRGESFKLTCVFRGQPKIQLEWLRDGLTLATSDVVTIQDYNDDDDDSATTVLSFQKIQMSENGKMFSCSAFYPETKVKVMSSSFVKVIGAVPSVKLLKVRSREIDVQLELVGVVSDDIIDYAVRMKSLHKDETRRFPFTVNETQVTVIGLDPFTTYHISVAFVYNSGELGSEVPFVGFTTSQEAPSGPPLDFTVLPEGYFALGLSWQPPSIELQRGIIISYQIHYNALDSQMNIVDVGLVDTNATTLIIKGLHESSRYDVTVRARTMVGLGPPVQPPISAYVKAPPQPDNIETSTATKSLIKINMIDVDEDNVVNITKRLQNVTKEAGLFVPVDITLTANILEKIVMTNTSSSDLGKALVNTVSNILNANSSVLKGSQEKNNTGMRFVKLLENWLETSGVNASDINEEATNVIVQKVNIVKDKVEKKIIFNTGDGSIEIPTEAVTSKNGTDDSVYFVYYKKNDFFNHPPKYNVVDRCVDGFTVEERQEVTPVMSSSVTGRHMTNLSKPVILKFKWKGGKDTQQSIGNFACVYWDFNAGGDKGFWSKRGCRLHEVVNHTVVCHCDHMTNFAALMDVYAQTSRICGVHSVNLSNITIVGCCLSLVGLCLTMLTYGFFRRLRKEVAAKVLIQLCFSLFVLIIVFLFGVEKTSNANVCMAVAILLHYFSLVAFMWMLMEAVFMYQAFVRVWPPHEDGDIVKCMVAAWGFPGVIVLVSLVTGIDHYGGKHYCRVVGLPFIIGFLIPICLIIFANMIIFITIMYKLGTRPVRSSARANVNALLLRLKRAFGILILMGLTWVLGAFAISNVRLVFQYMFACLNSIQGLAIFVFYCLMQKSVRDAWIAFIRCDTRSESRIKSDSYYERRRLSSASQSGTLNSRARTNSSQMMTWRSNKDQVNTVALLTDNQQMQTIVEVDIPDLTDEEHPNVSRTLPPPRHSFDISASSAEDEAARLGPPLIAPYRSYRALSSASRPFDALDKGDINNKRRMSRSNEALIRKSLYVGGSSPLIPMKERVRPVKSCEMLHRVLNMKEEQPLLIDFNSLKRKQPQTNKPPTPINDTPSTPTAEVPEQLPLLDSSSETTQNESVTSPTDHTNEPMGAVACESCGTLKRSIGSDTTSDDALTLIAEKLAVLERAVLDRARSKSTGAAPGPLPNGIGRNPEDIMKWLNESVEYIDNSDFELLSNTTSEEYKTSLASSLTDVTAADMRSARSSVYSENNTLSREKRRRRAEEKLLGRLIVGPVHGSVRGLEGHVDVSVISYDDMIDCDEQSQVFSNTLPRDDVPAIRSDSISYKERNNNTDDNNDSNSLVLKLNETDTIPDENKNDDCYVSATSSYV